MNLPPWYLPAIGGLFVLLTKSLVLGKGPPKFRIWFLLVSLLVLCGASREPACSPLPVSGIPDKPGTEQALTTSYLTAGFFGKRTAPATGGELSRNRDRLLFEQNCTLCHTTNLVKERTAGWSRNRIRTALDQLNRLHPSMPDFLGTPQEKDRLADYIYLLNNAEPGSGPKR